MITTHFMCFLAGEAEPVVGLPLWRRSAGAEPGGFILKSPDSTIDLAVEWTLAEGETIISSTWSITQLISDDGLAVVGGSPRIEGALAVVMVEGGVFRRTATLNNTIMTSAGRVLVESVSFRFGPAEMGA